MNSDLIKCLLNKYRITDKLLGTFLEVPESTARRWRVNPEKIPIQQIGKVCQLLDIKISDVIPDLVGHKIYNSKHIKN